MVHYLSRDGLRVGSIALFALTQSFAGYVPQALGLGGSIAAQSSAVANPLNPPGWAFAIWGLIFLGALVFAIFSCAPQRLSDPRLRRVGWLAAAVFALNTAWELYVPIFGLGLIPTLCIAVQVGLVYAALLVLPVTPPGQAWIYGVYWPLGLLAGWLTAALFLATAGTFLRYGVSAWWLWPALQLVEIVLVVALVRRFSNAGHLAALLWALGATAIGAFAVYPTEGALAASGFVLALVTYARSKR